METKEEDIVEDLFVASTHSFLLFFTNKGKVHWLKVHEIPEGGRQAKGKAMANVLSLAENERVATCVPVRDFESGGYVLFATKQGKVKKTELSAFSHPRAGGIQAITLEDGDEVMGARRTDGQREVLLSTKQGMIIRFPEDEVRPMGRTAAGVRGIDVDEGDQVIAAETLKEGVTILTVTERGYGKRTPLDEYRLQGLAGNGVIAIQTDWRDSATGGAEIAVAPVLAADTERSRLVTEAEDLKAERNRTSEAIGQAKRRGEDPQAAMARMREVSERIKVLDGLVKEVDARLEGLLLEVPNLPHASVPVGRSADDNVEVRRWGAPRQFAFEPKQHFEIGEALGILDFDRASKIAKSRVTVMRRAASRLNPALVQLRLDLPTPEHGFTEVWDPHLLKPETIAGEARLPKV